VNDDIRPRGVASDRLRERTLSRFENRIEPFMAALGVIWVALFVIEMTRGLSPLLGMASTVIWILFIIDFGLRLALAPRRLAYLRRNWLTALSLVLPALRIARVGAVARLFRASRGARGLRLVRAITSLNRGMGALGATMRKRGTGYVLLLTMAVLFAGAAGMYALEPRDATGGGFASYGDALWWTAMIITTLGSAYWPRTPEGRILAVIISLYAIGVFGYVTATLASFFIERDASDAQAPLAGRADIVALHREITALRVELEGRRARDAAG
jgi:voltage-gated potassium channel